MKVKNKSKNIFNFENFKKLREEKGLTLRELELEIYKKMNSTVYPQIMGRWESGQYRPNLAHMVLIAKFFEKPIEYFLK